MKRLTACVFALALASGGHALADTPGADWMPADQVKAQLTKAGYSDFSEFEADDGHWEGEGVKNGRRMQFHADARTGAIISEKPND